VDGRPGHRDRLIDPGKPWQNSVGESFNGKFRGQCLSLEWFLSRGQAKIVIDAWGHHYNEVRPHSSLGYLTPAEFAAKLKQEDAAPALRDTEASVSNSSGRYTTAASQGSTGTVG
jgi:hypothetical protein